MIDIPEPDDRLAEVIRTEGARILATLVRTTGRWSVAEDAVQEAAIAALRDWPRTGVPEDPRAWLVVTARRKAIDALRRENARAGKEREGVDLMALLTPDPPPASVVRDDQLRLIFTCCHPALSLDAQVALALRTLCQLSVEQVAAVLLTSPAAMAKRLTRTRQKITAAQIPYVVPGDAELPGRLAGVCGVVHTLYTSGHAPLAGDAVLDVDVCREAIRLGRLVHDLMPDEAMPAAVLALMLLTESRRAARVDADGEVVVLADQDRTRWDRHAAAEGMALLDGSLRRTSGMADAYQLQAAIAAEHARAERYADTDWTEIVRLYDLLLGVAATPAAALARAVAVGERDGPSAGVAELDRLSANPRVSAVRAEFLAREGRLAEALVAIEASLAEELTGPERRYRERRLQEWRDACVSPPKRSSATPRPAFSRHEEAQSEADPALALLAEPMTRRQAEQDGGGEHEGEDDERAERRVGDHPLGRIAVGKSYRELRRLGHGVPDGAVDEQQGEAEQRGDEEFRPDLSSPPECRAVTSAATRRRKA